MLGQGSDRLTHAVMQLLGFDMSVDKESPYASLSEMLGIVLDTSDEAMGAVHLRNRPERSEAMSKSLGEVIESKKVSSREPPSGRLQFLSLSCLAEWHASACRLKTD